jgi:dihydroorotase
MGALLIKGGEIINEGRRFRGDLLIINDKIAAIGEVPVESVPQSAVTIDANGLLIIPGAIDDQVHFREPGLTHKGDIRSESRAAVAGGITSFMEMPNTSPQAITNSLLEDKYRIASENSSANYSFYIGGTNSNLDELLNTDPERVCGIKLFLGSSTGNMLVDDLNALKNIFSRSELLIACHCEDEPTIRKNSAEYRQKYGDNIPVQYHPLIRSRDACFLTSSFAVNLAKEYNTRLNVLHISTADELKLFSNTIPLEEKRITSEICVHHLWFDESAYERLGNKIKWNPAIKTRFDRDALRAAVNNGLADIIATDHAPHTAEEKSSTYFKAPSGGPLVQHSLPAMLELCLKGVFTVEKVVEKMCHNPAIIYKVKDRGFIREGYKADIVLVNLRQEWEVSKENILYKCGWSPFEGEKFSASIVTTVVNGNIVYNKGVINESIRGERLIFRK